MARGVTVIGDSVGAAQAALTLAELGVEVNIITSSPSLGLNNTVDSALPTSSELILTVLGKPETKSLPFTSTASISAY